MSTIYLVTAGEYSAYYIVAVFSTRELADEYVAKYNDTGRGYKAEVEEYEIDRQVPTRVAHVWRSSIQLQDGAIVYRGEEYELVGPDSDDDDHDYLERPGNLCTTAFSEVSQEHADKIAIERRQKWLRESPHAKGQAVANG